MIYVACKNGSASVYILMYRVSQESPYIGELLQKLMSSKMFHTQSFIYIYISCIYFCWCKVTVNVCNWYWWLLELIWVFFNRLSPVWLPINLLIDLSCFPGSRHRYRIRKLSQGCDKHTITCITPDVLTQVDTS